MQKVLVKKWGQHQGREIHLDDALTPNSMDFQGGQLEEAQATANKACEAMGHLLAHLVETGAITFENAVSIAGTAGHYGTMELIDA